MSTFTESKKRLEKCGIKPSLQRIAVTEYLMTHCTHPTVDTIFNDLYPSIPTLSKTTVYNTVKLLAEHNAISTVNIDEKNVRYDGDISKHAHFRCKHCGCIFDVPISNIKADPIENDTENFIIMDTLLYYKGLCKRCKS